MTVIAWDGTALAADKRAISGGGIARTVTKIVRHEGALLGITGCWDTGAEMLAWWRDGAKPADFPKTAREDKATLIVIDAQGIRIWCTGPYPMWIEAERCAWGSGRDFAEAVMHLGLPAEMAVRVACEFQSDCGNGIDVLALTP